MNHCRHPSFPPRLPRSAAGWTLLLCALLLLPLAGCSMTRWTGWSPPPKGAIHALLHEARLTLTRIPAAPASAWLRADRETLQKAFHGQMQKIAGLLVAGDGKVGLDPDERAKREAEIAGMEAARDRAPVQSWFGTTQGQWEDRILKAKKELSALAASEAAEDGAPPPRITWRRVDGPALQGVVAGCRTARELLQTARACPACPETAVDRRLLLEATALTARETASRLARQWLPRLRKSMEEAKSGKAGLHQSIRQEKDPMQKETLRQQVNDRFQILEAARDYEALLERQRQALEALLDEGGKIVGVAIGADPFQYQEGHLPPDDDILVAHFRACENKTIVPAPESLAPEVLSRMEWITSDWMEESDFLLDWAK